MDDGPAVTPAPGERAPAGPVVRLAERLALAGGLVSLSVAGLVVVSVLGRWLLGKPVTGDFDLVQMATAVSVFAFLHTFTSWLPRRLQRAIDTLWDLVYAGMAGLMTYCLINGTVGEWRSGTTAQMIALPIWPAVAVCAMMCAVLALAAVATAVVRSRS